MGSFDLATGDPGGDGEAGGLDLWDKGTEVLAGFGGSGSRLQDERKDAVVEVEIVLVGARCINFAC